MLAISATGRGLSLYRERQFPAAEKEFRRILAANPRDSNARLLLARTLIELNRIPEALRELERGLQGTTDPEIRFQAGRIARELAERRLADLQSAAPGSAALHELAGERSERKGDLAEALREYRAAASVEPARPGVHFLAGNVLWKMRELDAATAELKAELNSNPDHARANLRLGQIGMARNDESSAIPFLERAAAAMPQSIEAHRELGKAFRKAGRDPEARREWEMVVKLRPEDDQVHYLLAGLYRALGETARANQELEKHRQILSRRRRR
jgi:predicted Zn-dependent protease